MRLSVQHRERIPADGLERTYLCGPDDLHGELPWFGRAYFSDEFLVIERSESDSGCVHVPWNVTGHGELTLSSATLRERYEPYQLEVELARGTVNRLRNQLANWEMMGLVVSDELREATLEACRRFSRSATAQHEPERAAELAELAITAGVDAILLLTNTYTTQAMSVRRPQGQKLSTLLGIQLGNQMPELGLARQLPAAFNLSAARMSWRWIESSEGKREWSDADAQIEWAHQAGMKIAAGPLLEFTDFCVPDWAYLWEGDFDALRNFMFEHVRRTVQRYRGKVQLWQIASRMCHGRALALSEEQRLQIVAQSIHVAREADPRTPMIISFDQPWGEHLAHEQLDLAPLHFADALVRADLGLSGLGLEINLGYHPRASSYRTPLALSRLIDYWSMLELPLLVSLTLPSSAAADPRADSRVRVSGDPKSGDVSPDAQRRWVEQNVPLLLAKNSVQVVIWNQLTDAHSHEFPHSGLFDAQHEAKPAFEALGALRREYLM
jgi:hypothetical protein